MTSSSSSPSSPQQIPVSSSQSPSLFHQVFTYPFATDREFQQGLRVILDSVSSPEQAEALTLDAQCFYYARKHALPPLDVDAYRTWLLQSQPLSPNEPSTQIPNLNDSLPDSRSVSNQAVGAVEAVVATSPQQPATAAAPYPTSFGQIVDLITKGEPIPGIKDVPDTLLSGQESRAVTAKRKKPWERNEGDGGVDDVVARSDPLTQR